SFTLQAESYCVILSSFKRESKLTIMNLLRIISGIVGFGLVTLGVLYSISPNNGERMSGASLIQSGAIIIAGLIIALAISDRKQNS
ncbi:MAG TPA: hypothetical protein VJL58_03600, partial [Pyrinomonadaceae bacterium]|nr:hypothetical protein [Pyrinomonadaceae bacterium]